MGLLSIDVFGIETINRGVGRINRMAAAFQDSGGTINSLLESSGERVLEALQDACPVGEDPVNFEDGEVVEHTHARDLLEFEVEGDEAHFSGPEYLQYVIEGTDDPIQGNPWVAFISGGEIFVRTEVSGHEGNDFRRTAWDDARDDVQEIVHEVGMKIVRGEALED